MSKPFNMFKKLYNKKIDASGLAVFRVLYGLTLLGEVLQMFYFRHLIYDKIPYLEPSEIDFGIPLVLWMLVIIFLIFGLFTRWITIINYLFSLIFIATISSYEYHMFYVYVNVNFLLIFTSTSRVFSLDRLIQKLKYSNSRVTYNPTRKVSVLNYHIFILAAIGFVYFDSIFFKLTSYNWMNGLGMWLPASIPQVTHIKNSLLLNIEWLAIGLGYLTLVFEAIFIFVFFRKMWRVPLLIIGIGLHLGILMQFPIPWFALGLIAIYLLMVPVGFWKWCRFISTFNNPKLTFYYDEECPLCNRTKIILGYFDYFEAIEFKGLQTYGFEDQRLKDWSKEDLLDNIYSITRSNKILNGIDTYRASFKYTVFLFPLYILLSIPGIYHLGKLIYKNIAENRYVESCTEENCGFAAPSFPHNSDEIKLTKGMTFLDLKLKVISVGLMGLFLFQINVTYNSALIKDFRQNIGFDDTFGGVIINKASFEIRKISQVFLGVTSHPVFMDAHFKNYNHIIAIQAVLDNGKEVWLPIIGKKGMPVNYIYSFNWVKWTWRVNNPTINKRNLSKGVRDFTAFWAHKNGYDLNDIRFNLKVKKTEIPRHWEKDFLQKQLNNPWLSGGYVTWKNEKFYSNIKDIESL